MDQQPTVTSSDHHQPAAKTPALTLRIPKPNWQVTALILIALIAGFQTIQLAKLKGTVSAKAATTTTTTTPASDSSGLQSQVGGC